MSPRCPHNLNSDHSYQQCDACISQQKMLEEQKQQVQAQQQRYAAARERLDQIMKTFTTVQAGAENLAAKLVRRVSAMSDF